MKYFTLTILFLLPFIMRGQLYENDRLLTMRSNDSINEEPRLKGALGINMKLNGYFDVFGGLQESETFNVGAINVFGTDDSSSFQMDLYQTQVFIQGDYIQKNGEKLKAVVEFDFWGGNGHMRLRKAYVETNHWQIGQNWNNFGDETLWPNILEWEGPPSGVWVRSPHIKYMNKLKNETWHYSFSLEAPIVDYIALGELEPLVEEANQITPDLTAALGKKFKNGHLRVSSVLRNVRYKLDGEIGDYTGFGFTVCGILKSEKGNNFQFQLIGGKGINAYLTSVTGLGYDGYPTANGNFKATPSYGGWASYEYFFTPKFHSNVVLGFTEYSFDNMERFIISEDIPGDPIDDTLLLNGNYSTENIYGIFNLMFEPFERMTVGLELNYGIKNIDFSGYANNVFLDDSQDRDALRLSFGFMFFL